jgi:hypothetical protein
VPLVIGGHTALSSSAGDWSSSSSLGDASSSVAAALLLLELPQAAAAANRAIVNNVSKNQFARIMISPRFQTSKGEG